MTCLAASLANISIFPFETGRTIFVETVAKDGKLNLGRSVLTNCWDREQPCHVVEARPEVVKNLSGENRESEWYAQRVEVLQFLAKRLNVFITHDWVLAFLEESGDLGLKINDVLVGPF